MAKKFGLRPTDDHEKTRSSLSPPVQLAQTEILAHVYSTLNVLVQPPLNRMNV